MGRIMGMGTQITKLLNLALVTAVLFVMMFGILPYSNVAHASETVVDNTSAELTGTWTTATANANYYGANYSYSNSGTGTDKIRWRPTITAVGDYSVYVRLPNGDTSRATNAPFTIYYNGGSQTYYINEQSIWGGQWVLLGTHNFAAGTSGYVELTDNANGTYVIADAIKFTQDVSVQSPGATIPWTTFEAEDGSTNGTVLSSVTLGNLAYEASGRKAVTLDAVGKYVQITSNRSADRLTIRYSIPKDTSGTLSLYINGVHKQDLSLNSARTWRTQTAVTGGYFRFYDEIIVTETISSGDVIKLQKDSGDTVSSYTIDFFELETRPAALTVPDGSWLSITDYGATGTDTSDDYTAITNTITAANSGNKKVWIPAGTYYISDQITVPAGITIAGAGMWYSVINKNIPATSVKKAFSLGDSDTIKNIKISDIQGNNRINGHEGIRLASNSTVDGVWLENTFGAGIIGFSTPNVIIKNNRVRGTFADAIHLARNTQFALAENNTVRNAGDDGMAMVPYDELYNYNNTYKYNTVENNYWGRGMTIIGGNANTLEYNVIKDSAWSAGIMLGVENYLNQPVDHNTNFLVQYNDVIRSGQTNNNSYSAIWVYGGIDKPLAGNIQYNHVIDEVKHGITLQGYAGNSVNVKYNTFEAPGPGGLYIITGLQPGYTPVVLDNILK
ncbi:glycosyl hydrolase family 28-related protein [Paenibacillus whitsoniae]|uniref:Uncharacterized protein n=1 Tax=Paenibacillus whitsoniae TaxID=2496558 RepID=A0A430JBH8_9BACL|nr:glycosyl hydrolase family 28-related protein [Paenibacillus whitsoniae]RTE08371.1 hypothetical protein EJQ19_18290 [Paenibacillus whitsoniae]